MGRRGSTGDTEIPLQAPEKPENTALSLFHSVTRRVKLTLAVTSPKCHLGCYLEAMKVASCAAVAFKVAVR